jgi:hypothetical protein
MVASKGFTNDICRACSASVCTYVDERGQLCDSLDPIKIRIMLWLVSYDQGSGQCAFPLSSADSVNFLVFIGLVFR